MAPQSSTSTTALETCRVAPAPPPTAALSLPLTFFDHTWLHFHPIHRLFFFQIPNCSKSHFSQIILPQIKQSLSLTLKYYLPLAGRLSYPLNTHRDKPQIRYTPGDSVSFTVQESDADFNNLAGNHPRQADQFYKFVPELPQVTVEGDFKLLEILAVQVTLFAGNGICIGLLNHHVVGDATATAAFIKTWANISKSGIESSSSSSPIFDRSLVNEPTGINEICWNFNKVKPLQYSTNLPKNRIRSTFTLGKDEINKLKNRLQDNIPDLVHNSTFVAMSAYAWTCMVKSRLPVEGEDSELFLFSVDCRSRLDPPVPENYFGNCVAYGLVKVRHEELVGELGFFAAGEAIAKEIKNRVNDGEKLMIGAENWLEEIRVSFEKPIFSVAGSTKVGMYGLEFGWGNVRKVEPLSIDEDKCSMSVCRSRDGGLEIGLSSTGDVLEAFGYAFRIGLE